MADDCIKKAKVVDWPDLMMIFDRSLRSTDNLSDDDWKKLYERIITYSYPNFDTYIYRKDGISVAYIFMAVFFMLIIANIKERLNKRWMLGYIFFQSLYIAILFYTYVGISSILVVTTVSITLFCIWWLPPQQMRVIGGLNCFTYLAYQISIKKWAGLLEILVILSNLFSFLKYKKSDNI